MTRKEKAQMFIDIGFKNTFNYNIHDCDLYDLRYGPWRVIITIDNCIALGEWDPKRMEFVKSNFESALHRMPMIIQDNIIFNMEIFNGNNERSC